MIKPKIDRNSKILSISHADGDGVACQIILGQVFKNIKYLNTAFYKVDKILESVMFDDYDYVFLTDLHPEKKENMTLSPKIIMIDHHESAKHLHKPEEFHYVLTDHCAAYHVKRFIESLYGIKLTFLNNFIYLTNDYDMYTLKNNKSKLMYDLCCNYYKPIKFREKFFDGRTRFNSEEIAWLRKRREQYNDEWNNLNVYDMESIKGCIIEQSDFMNEIANNLILKENYRIVFVINPNTRRISIRHNIENFDAGNYLKEKGWGGGHKVAAGFFCDEQEDIEKRINIIEKHLLKNFSL